MSGRRGSRRILIAAGVAVALALGGAGTATGASKAVVSKHYGPLEIVNGQTARLNATNLYTDAQKFSLTLYDGLGSVLKTSSLNLNAGASASIEYQSVDKNYIIRGLTRSANSSVDGSLEVYDTLGNNENVLTQAAPLLTISGKAPPVGISKSETAVLYVTNLGTQSGTFTMAFFDISGVVLNKVDQTVGPNQTGMVEYDDPLIDGRAVVRGSITVSVAGRFMASFGVKDGSGRLIVIAGCPAA